MLALFSHCEQFRTILLCQFAVEHCDCFLQVFPLLCYFLLSLLQQLHLFLSLPPQSFKVLAFLLLQKTMEVLKLGSDFPFQVIKAVLKNVWES